MILKSISRPAGGLTMCSTLAALLLLATGDAPASAMLPASPAAAPEAAATQPAAIEAERDSGSDARIARRINGIFSEVPDLTNVTARADEGVVTLSGSVESPEASARAAAIAERVQGVVTVENTIERDVSLEGGLGLGGFGARLAGFTRMLPLLGAALLVGLLIAAVGYLLASLTGLWRRLAPNGFLAELIASAIRFIFLIGGLVVALDMIGAGALLGAVLGGAGVIGIALGFAMRDTIENYVASLMLSLRQPFRPNDHVVIEDHEGRVIRLTSRATILMTLDGNHLRIPNSSVFKAVILNYTRNPQRRFDFVLGIDSDDDPDAARRLGCRALGELSYVLGNPAPEARVVELGDSNIVLQFLGWIDQRQTDWFKARSRAIAHVKAALEEAGFALPEPIYRLRFDQRGGTPSFENVSNGLREAPDAGPPRPRARARPSQSSDEDLSPEDEIARMVNDERASTTGEKDLLDVQRPVE